MKNVRTRSKTIETAGTDCNYFCQADQQQDGHIDEQITDRHMQTRIHTGPLERWQTQTQKHIETYKRARTQTS